MATRVKGRGLFYGRRSTDRQESGLESQLNWAIQTASSMGVPLHARTELLAEAQASATPRAGDLFIDDAISGSRSDRPGLIQLVQAAIHDEAVSHIFVHKRDRIARPDNPLEAANLEHQLLTAGVTIVFSDAIHEPSPDGRFNIVQALSAVIGYDQSGQFLRDLARRVIEAQQLLAKQGFSTGGRPPYGFGRFLRFPDGKLEPVPDGRRIRQEGCHIVHLPVDETKIATWISILEMKEQGLGCKKIANKLNEMGILSPDAGRIRKDQGQSHMVSGQWSPNAVAFLCRNPIIAGCLRYGTRSEGRHLRWTKDGVRPLKPDEKSADGNSIKRVVNDKAEVIEARASFDPLFSEERFEAIQQQMIQRGRSQRGVPRSHDRARYPLATRVVDLTEGCGALMYGTSQTAKKGPPTLIYKCGRYCNGRGCYHNRVDAEVLLELVLRTIKHLISRTGSRDALAQKLLELAGQGSGRGEDREAQIRRLERQLAKVHADRQTIAGKLAVESDPSLEAAFRQEWQSRSSKAEQIEGEISKLRLQAGPQKRTPEETVGAALKLLDQLERLASVPEARTKINHLLKILNVWIGLDFTSAKWGKRTVRRVQRGFISFGEYRLPVPLHGADACDEYGNSSGRDSSAEGTRELSTAAAQPITGTAVDQPRPRRGSAAPPEEREISFRKVSRGDRI